MCCLSGVLILAGREQREGQRSIPSPLRGQRSLPTCARCPPCPVPLCSPAELIKRFSSHQITCETSKGKCFWANPTHFDWK